jgi:hypothetical protein
VWIAARDRWRVSWRKGVVSSTSTMASIGGMAQRCLEGCRMMFDMCRAGVMCGRPHASVDSEAEA